MLRILVDKKLKTSIQFHRQFTAIARHEYM